MSLFKDRMGRSLSLDKVGRKVIIRLYNYLADFGLLWLNLLCLIPLHSSRRLLLKLGGAKIGKDSYIHSGCTFFSVQRLTIGAGSILGSKIFIDGRDHVEIGSHVDIASEVMIYNSEHDINSIDFKAILAPVKIGDYVFIGPRSIILPGVIIGKGAVVAAGAVVTKSVADFKIVGGVPAQVIGEREHKELSYRLGRARLFQ